MDEFSHANDAAFWLTAAAILVLLIVSALLAAAETALGAASRTRLQARADKGDAGASAALLLTMDRDRLVGTILLGRTLAAILAASLATAFFDRLSGGNGVLTATLVIAALILVLAEALPRSYAISVPEDAAALLARPALVLIRLLTPPLRLLRMVGRALLAPFGIRADPSSDLFSVKAEIADALSIGEATGAVQKEDRDRLMGALDLGNRTVEEIMLHRSQIQMIDADKPAADILDAALTSPHTRLPIFRDERENVVGIIHAKDLLRAINRAVRQAGDRAAIQDFDVMAVASKPYFIPDTTALDEQMREFLKRRTHFALVVDEYGSLRGLVTLEDILEEIVGEIADEHDRETDHKLTPDAQGNYAIEGATTIRDLNRQLDWSLPDDEANTIAGLVIHMAQSIPEEGQVFSFGGYRFEVVKRRENRITRLRVRPLDSAPT